MVQDNGPISAGAPSVNRPSTPVFSPRPTLLPSLTLWQLLGCRCTASSTSISTQAGREALTPMGGLLLEIDYQTSGPRSCFISVNGGTAMKLDLNGSTFNDPVPIVLPVQLRGTNTISIGNPTGYAPDLDRIVVAPEVPG